MKTAIVTGASKGVGHATVKLLSESGYRVIAVSRNIENISKLVSDHVEVYQLDITQPNAIKEFYEKYKDITLDLLVNNAGDCLMSEFPEIPREEFELQMSVNFSSAFYCSQFAVKSMLKRPGIKKIVNISSNGAYNFDVFDPPHYRASKAALDTLTKDLARRYAKAGISVNSIAPAMTQTPLFDVLSKEVLYKAISQMPRGSAMKPEEIAAWVGFLVSPAGDVSSGNVIILNQGRDVR